MLKSNIELFEIIQREINSFDFKEKYRQNPKDFTRRRKLDFPTIVVSLINKMSKSISVEINQFLFKFGWKKDLTVSKQSFSEARFKLKHEAFIALNDKLVSNFYQSSNCQLYANKYLLLATDGTTYRLPYETELLKEFDQMDNGQTQAILAKGVKIYDVLNRLSIYSRLTDYRTIEGKNFDACWEKVSQLLDIGTAPTILLGDRHYPTFKRMIELDNQGVKFVFRCKTAYCHEIKAFAASKKKDAIIKIDLTIGTRPYSLKKQGLKTPPKDLVVRAVKVPMTNQPDVILLTSILDSKELNTVQIQQIYPHRWKEETSFGLDKNRLEVENFSSKTVEGIKQDFYAGLLTVNLAELIIMDAQSELEKQNKNSSNKYQYQINRSVALGLMKDQIPNFFLAKEEAHSFFIRMKNLFLRFKEPIRPNRSFPRKVKHNLKYSMNLRRVT
jgi:hypothetical protein